MIRKQLFGDRCDNDRRGRTQFYLEDRSDSSDRCDHEKLLSRNFSDRFDEKYISTAKYNITYVQEFIKYFCPLLHASLMYVRWPFPLNDRKEL